MSQGGALLLMGSEASFLQQWEESHTWQLPNNFSNSENFITAGVAGESSEKNKMEASNSDSGGAQKATPGKELGLVQNNNKKRGRGANVGISNNKKGKKNSTEADDEAVKEGKGKGNGDASGSGSGSGSGGGESDHEIHIWTERERRKKMRNMFANLHALLPQLPPKADKSTIVDEAVNYIRNLQQTFDKLQKQKLEKLQAGATNSPVNTFTNIIGEPSINNMSNNSQPKLVYDSREAYLADQGCCNELVSIGNKNNNNNNNNNNTNCVFPVLFQTWTSSNVVLNVCGEEAYINVCSPKKPGLFTSICYVLEKHKISIISAQLSSDSNRNMYMIHAHASSTGVGSNHFAEAFSSVEEVFKQAVREIMLWVSS